MGPEAPPPPPSRTNWTRLVPPPVLTGHDFAPSILNPVQPCPEGRMLVEDPQLQRSGFSSRFLLEKGTHLAQCVLHQLLGSRLAVSCRAKDLGHLDRFA